MSEEKKTRE